MKKRVCVVTVLLLLLMTIFNSNTALADTNINSYTPYNLAASLMDVDEMHPYGSTELVFKINNLPRCSEDTLWGVSIEKKIGQNGEWTGVSFVKSDTYLDENSLGNSTYRFEQIWNEDTAWTTDILVSYRVSVSQCDSTFSAVGSSAWSNIASIGLKSSAWATSAIEKADNYGLIPASISGDFTQPITREEFAELSVKLYEVFTGKNAEPVSPNPFMDCTNPEILKSNSLGIVKGISSTKFDPKALTNREQIAAMLNRAAQIMKPDSDFSPANAPVFSDEKNVSSWALDNVKFMAKQGFIAGVGENRFDPKGTATREQAVAIALRVYEKYSGITE
jgi:hypothetical protein